MKQAIDFQDREKYIDALDCYDEILKLDPNCFKAWHDKGITFKIKNYNESVLCFNKALELNPDNAMVWYIKEMH